MVMRRLVASCLGGAETPVWRGRVAEPPTVPCLPGLGCSRVDRAAGGLVAVSGLEGALLEPGVLVGRVGIPGGVMAVYVHGAVGGPAASWVSRVVAEALSGGGGPEYLELHLYSSLALMEALLSGEAARLGVGVSAVFPVAFEAWTGVPRIHAALAGGVYGLTRLEAESLLAHEAMHAVLHASPEYYTAPQTGDPFAAYAAAASLKDLEANMELRRRGLRRQLYGLQAYWLREYEGSLPCGSLGEAFDTLRAATAWIALNEKPPLRRECRGALRGPLEFLEALASNGSERPWRRLAEYARLVEEALSALDSL